MKAYDVTVTMKGKAYATSFHITAMSNRHARSIMGLNPEVDEIVSIVPVSERTKQEHSIPEHVMAVISR